MDSILSFIRISFGVQQLCSAGLSPPSLGNAFSFQVPNVFVLDVTVCPSGTHKSVEMLQKISIRSLICRSGGLPVTVSPAF